MCGHQAITQAASLKDSKHTAKVVKPYISRDGVK